MISRPGVVVAAGAILAALTQRSTVRAAECAATSKSMTPLSWRSSAPPTSAGKPATGLKLVREVSLPGPTNRFDYQSVDASRGRIYMNHMNAGRTIVFDADSSRVITEIAGVSRPTGIRVVAPHHEVYISTAGSHEVAIVDDRELKIVARVGGIRFPDGIAYATDADKVFVSDESGDADVVIDPTTHSKRATIPVGGEAGNTQYDSVSRCILVAVQTRNQLVAIDPVSEKVVQRYDLRGSDHPHGFSISEPRKVGSFRHSG